MPLKQNLIEKMDKRIGEIQKEIKESQDNMKELRIDLAVEERLTADSIDINIARTASTHKDQIKANVEAIASMQTMEQNKVDELTAELEILQARKHILEKIPDEEIERHAGR